MGVFNFSGDQALVRGDDFFRSVFFRDPATKDPIDITGWTFRSQARLDDGAGLILPGWDVSDGSGIVIVSAVGGEIRYDIPRADTENWTEAQNESCIRYDLEATAPAPIGRFTALRGAVQIRFDVTLP